jgi:hypothetical protein
MEQDEGEVSAIANNRTKKDHFQTSSEHVGNRSLTKQVKLQSVERWYNSYCRHWKAKVEQK